MIYVSSGFGYDYGIRMVGCVGYYIEELSIELFFVTPSGKRTRCLYGFDTIEHTLAACIALGL